MEKNQNVITISMKENEQSKEEICNYVKNVIWASGQKGIGLSELSNLVHGKYSSFSVKDFGYSQFSKFVQGIGGVETFEDGHNRKKVKKQS